MPCVCVCILHQPNGSHSATHTGRIGSEEDPGHQPWPEHAPPGCTAHGLRTVACRDKAKERNSSAFKGVRCIRADKWDACILVKQPRGVSKRMALGSAATELGAAERVSAAAYILGDW